MAGTREDAQLLVQLAQWGASMGLQEAISTILADDFDPDAASVADKSIHVIYDFAELIGVLVKHDLLNRELVLDWFWFEGAWQLLAPAVHRAREKYGEPSLGGYFEALAAT
jgi:hypothetical protein